VFAITFGFRDFSTDVGVIVRRAGHVDGVVTVGARRRERRLGWIGIRRQGAISIASTDLRSIGAAAIDDSVHVAWATEFRRWRWVSIGVGCISVASSVIVGVAIGRVVVAVFRVWSVGGAVGHT